MQLLNALSSQSMTTEMIRVFVGISVAFGIASVLADRKSTRLNSSHT